MRYKSEWHRYKKEFGDQATLSYDSFVRMAHMEEQDLIFKDLARQAVEMDARNKAEPLADFVGSK